MRGGSRSVATPAHIQGFGYPKPKMSTILKP